MRRNVMFAAAALLCACTAEIPQQRAETEECRLKLAFSTATSHSKSALFPEEDLRDLNIFVWRDGYLVDHIYTDAVDGDVSLALVNGGVYDFYAIANCGKSVSPAQENWQSDEESMRSLELDFPTGEGSLYPLCGVIRSVSLNGQDNRLDFALERLVCRIGLRFLPDEALNGSGIRITGIRTIDAAASIYPFSERNKAEEGRLVAGDYASEADLEKINSGGEVEFFVYENCWGELLPNNTDQKQKVPESFGNLRGPTYIEVDCCFGENKLLNGKLTYRIFPGRNATTDFDLVRNSSCVISLFASKDGLDELSWRIEQDTGFNNYLARMEVTEGHALNNLYMGEVFKARISGIDPSITAYFGGNLETMADNISLRCIKGGMSDPVTFNICGTDGMGILVEGTCRAVANAAELWICDRAGNCVTRLSNDIFTSSPQFVFSGTARAVAPTPLAEDQELIINGSLKMFHIHLCDRNGKNLNSAASGCYGFDPSVFNFRQTNNSSSWAYAGNCLISRLTRSNSSAQDGMAWGSVELKFNNNGQSESVNRELWSLVRSDNPIKISVIEQSLGTIASINYGLDYKPLKVHFCDAGYGSKAKAETFGVQSRLFFHVENESRMSFNLTHITLAEAGESYYHPASVSVPSGMKYYFYNCPSDWNLPELLYLIFAQAKFPDSVHMQGSGCTSRASGTDFIIELNGTFEKLLDAVKCADSQYFSNNFGYQGSLPYSYLYTLNDGIRTMIDIWTDEGGEVNYDYTPELENGSPASSIVYDDYPIKWSSFYSDGVLLDAKDKSYNISNLYGSLSDVNPKNISKLMDCAIDLDFQIKNPGSSSPYYGMTFSSPVQNTGFPYVLICDGRCEVHPKGQWGNADVRYPSSTASNSNPGRRTHSGTENLTGDGISNCFTNIYNTVFKDYYSNLAIESKSWQHHSHPTKLKLYPDIALSPEPQENYLWNMTFSQTDVIYNNPGYDANYDQNPYTVKATMDFSNLHKNFTHRMVVIR